MWVIVGDLPPLYISTEDAPNPASALDGYLGAMQRWVDFSLNGKIDQKCPPVRAEPTKEHGEMLKRRIKFIDEEILSAYREDLDEKCSQEENAGALFVIRQPGFVWPGLGPEAEVLLFRQKDPKLCRPFRGLSTWLRTGQASAQTRYVQTMHLRVSEVGCMARPRQRP